MTERKTGKITHANCACPCHFEHNGGDIFPATDNCCCGYDGRDEPRPRDMYFGTAGEHLIPSPVLQGGCDIGLANQKIGRVPQESHIYDVAAMLRENSSRVRFYSSPIPSSHKVATVWTDPSGHLHIKMDMDNVFDVIFEGADILRPRNIQLRSGGDK